MSTETQSAQRGYLSVREAVKAESLGKTYLQGDEEVHALEGVSCAISSSEFVGVVGPSGSGKSTLLNILGLADAPSSGTLAIDGSVVDFSKGDRNLHLLRREKVGFVFQHFNLLSTLKAFENVMLPLVLNGASRKDAEARSMEALSAIGLSGKERRFPYELSGGEMQRVAVCRATIHAPSVVLADEPTGSLDPESGERVLELLRGLAASGHAIVMATHSARAMEYCTRLIELQGGRLSPKG